MTEDSVFYVGVDVSKAKHAIAIAEGGRDGVRYFGEIEATPAAVERLVRKLEKKHPRLHSATRPVRPVTGFIARSSSSATAAMSLRPR